MTSLILVAYATEHGSTKEVAEAIAATLRNYGLQVEIRPIREVRTLAGYSAVVLGAPLYLGRWHRDMLRFLLRHSVALSERPVAIFALGPISKAEQEWREAREQLDRALAKVPCLVPVAVAVFGGVLDPTQLCFPFNQMPASDVRDWTEIRAFADKLAAIAGMQGLSSSRQAVALPTNVDL